jgi:hypothetical protein
MSCPWCQRPPLEHNLEQAQACLERLAWREAEGGHVIDAMGLHTHRLPLAAAKEIPADTKRESQ